MVWKEGCEVFEGGKGLGVRVQGMCVLMFRIKWIGLDWIRSEIVCNVIR